ncbi:MAG: hypothetical protein ACHQ01_04175 [Candidatus Limnocylindrales bacterium]
MTDRTPPMGPMGGEDAARLDAITARWNEVLRKLLDAGVPQIEAVRLVTQRRSAEIEQDPALLALDARRYRASQEPDEAARRLADELGMPEDAIPMHAPPATKDGWRVDMFGELLTDDPPLDGPPEWPGWQAGPGSVSAEWLDERFGDSLPADERARLIEGRPALNVRAWQIVLRRDGTRAYLRAVRDRLGTWEVSVRGVETAEDARHVLTGLGFLRRQIVRAGGRPPGSGKRLNEAQAAVKKWRASTGKDGWPTAARLGQLLKPQVTAETARKYLAALKNAEANKPGE